MTAIKTYGLAYFETYTGHSVTWFLIIWQCWVTWKDFSGNKVNANIITVKDYWKSFNIIFIDFHLLSVCPIYSLLSVSIVLLFWHCPCCHMELCSSFSMTAQPLIIQMLILLHFHLKLACFIPLQFETILL